LPLRAKHRNKNPNDPEKFMRKHPNESVDHCSNEKITKQSKTLGHENNPHKESHSLLLVGKSAAGYE
jgi:hypothetical protein